MSPNGAQCRNVAAVFMVAAVAALSAGCGGDEDTVDPGSANPESALTLEEAQEPVKNAPPELMAIRDDANAIIDEGTEGYEARLEELEGIPVVVNNWASWCGPCREEFPYFQEQALERGSEVGFVGLLSGDGIETGATFLSEFPLPYPSYLDPDFDASIDIGTGKRLPSTAFYDSSGELVYLKTGPYGSAEELAADIQEYAQ